MKRLIFAALILLSAVKPCPAHDIDNIENVALEQLCDEAERRQADDETLALFELEQCNTDTECEDAEELLNEIRAQREADNASSTAAVVDVVPNPFRSER